MLFYSFILFTYTKTFAKKQHVRVQVVRVKFLFVLVC